MRNICPTGKAAERSAGGAGLHRRTAAGTAKEWPTTHRAPRVWSIAQESPDTKVIALAASVVKEGGIVIYPTETFYGLGGDPLSKHAVARIFRIKGRDFDKPLPLIAANLDGVLQVVGAWPPEAAKLAEAFWPGPLTMVLPAAQVVPPEVHACTGTIAVRISSHPVAAALAEAAGGLLVSTSANFSGQPASRDPDRIPPALLSMAEGILNAGMTGLGKWEQPTTIVDLTSPSPLLIRSGCVAWKAIAALLSL